MLNQKNGGEGSNIPIYVMRAIEDKLNQAIRNVARNKSYYEPQYRTPEAMNQLNEQYQYLPNKMGNISDSIGSQLSEDILKNKESKVKILLNGDNNE